jgi:DNA-binding LacI/PurR family transcriptional regulator
MEALFKNIEFPEAAVLHRRVTDHVRRLIAAGELKVGDQLPPGRTLARWMNIDHSAVQVALATLAREGVLTRTPGKGTRVASAKSVLRTVALFDRAEAPNGFFVSYLRESLFNIFHERGVGVRVIRDDRPAEEQAQPLDGLLSANRRGEFQALVVCSASWAQIRWLSRTGIPYVVSSPIGVPNRVQYDIVQGLRLAVRALAEQGCRSMGLIMPVPTTRQIEGEDVPEMPGTFEAALDAARHYGLSFGDAWIHSAGANPHVNGSYEQERFGYDEFKTLWASDERPDGLIVFPDTTARGVVTALLELGVKVPKQLRLVLHRNQEIPLLCPVQTTYLVSSVRALATAMIETLDHRMETGVNCDELVQVPFSIMPA